MMQGRQRRIVSAVAAVAVAAALQTLPDAGSSAQAQVAATAPGTTTASTDTCSKLAGFKLDYGSIESAATQPALAPVPGARLPGMTGAPGQGAPVAGLPAFCRVMGRLHPESGSDIRFEVWMPSKAWDGRLNGGNNGGFGGSISYNDLALAVRAGQAGASTDTGHEGDGHESAWAKDHPERVRDYGWRAIHLTAVAAKQLVDSFYGHAPDHSYFVSCSNGGRQALMEASRFPQDYDGIVAGAPAAVWTDLAMTMINTVRAGLPPGAPIRADQVGLLQQEVVKQCATSDGLVAEPPVCKFDVSKLACGVSPSAECFSPGQIIALKRIYAGPRDRSGRQVAASYPPSGAEKGDPLPSFGWEGFIVNGPNSVAQDDIFARGMLQDFFTTPFATPETFDFDKDRKRLKSALAADLDAQPRLRAFFERGGKLIIWHGWADAAIPPAATVAFYRSSLQNSGPLAAQSMRLFLVPGMQHCVGGTGAFVFGQFGAPRPGQTPERNVAAAVQAWVEHNRVPDSLVGRRGIAALMGAPGPEKQRLLCAYPSTAVLRPGADPEAATSYSCAIAKPVHSSKSTG
jgi:Tannase and feruloyl esterase